VVRGEKGSRRKKRKKKLQVIDFEISLSKEESRPCSRPNHRLWVIREGGGDVFKEKKPVEVRAGEDSCLMRKDALQSPRPSRKRGRGLQPKMPRLDRGRLKKK